MYKPGQIITVKYKGTNIVCRVKKRRDGFYCLPCTFFRKVGANENPCKTLCFSLSQMLKDCYLEEINHQNS